MPLVNVAGACWLAGVRPHPVTTADDIVRTIGGNAVCVRCRVLAISFLVRPVDPPAFYQRYVLPALLPIVTALPLLAHEMPCVARVRAGVAVGVLVIVMSAVLLASAPGRYRRLSTTLETSTTCRWRSATRLQGRSCHDGSVVDAGATRYFGSAHSSST
jgi:hypothetical protein